MPRSPHTEPAAGVVRDAVPFNRLPWIRPLVHSYAHEHASVASLFCGDPADPAAWRATVERVQRAPGPRAVIGPVLQAQLARREAPAEARAAASTLTHQDTVAVVTGQQAGLFGGPLYTLLKALTAIQLAREVREVHGVPAVALFWVEAEDHDWDEIRTTQVLDRDLGLTSIGLPPLAGAGSRPAAELVLDAQIGDTLAALEQALAPSTFTPALLDTLRRCYRPGVSVATAFATWLEALLGHQGLVVFESADPAAKPAVAGLFAQELERPTETARLARDAGRTLAARGHAAQIDPDDDTVCLFYMDGAGRRPIRYRDHRFVVGDDTREAAALADEARTHPERFSPNVLLRPIVQDALFPTVCYVAGPSELAYQAQLGGVYRAFGVEPPLLAPRASATLLDSAAARFLDRYQLPFESLQPQDESALNRLLESQLPPSLDDALAGLEQQVKAGTDRLRPAVVTIDPTLDGVVDRTLDRIRDTLKSLHGKIVQASKKKDETLRRQFIRTRGLTFPGGQPQERALGLAFFANRYGVDFGVRLMDALPVHPDHHYLIVP